MWCEKMALKITFFGSKSILKSGAEYVWQLLDSIFKRISPLNFFLIWLRRNHILDRCQKYFWNYFSKLRNQIVFNVIFWFLTSLYFVVVLFFIIFISRTYDFRPSTKKLFDWFIQLKIFGSQSLWLTDGFSIKLGRNVVVLSDFK